jgi:hypothetical protein
LNRNDWNLEFRSQACGAAFDGQILVFWGAASFGKDAQKRALTKGFYGLSKCVPIVGVQIDGDRATVSQKPADDRYAKRSVPGEKSDLSWRQDIEEHGVEIARVIGNQNGRSLGGDIFYSPETEAVEQSKKSEEKCPDESETQGAEKQGGWGFFFAHKEKMRRIRVPWQGKFDPQKSCSSSASSDPAVGGEAARIWSGK